MIRVCIYSHAQMGSGNGPWMAGQGKCVWLEFRGGWGSGGPSESPQNQCLTVGQCIRGSVGSTTLGFGAAPIYSQAMSSY